MTNFSELRQDLYNKNIFLDPRKTTTHQDNKLWIKLINNIIDSLSKHNKSLWHLSFNNHPLIF